MWGIVPYVALSVFVVGHVWRYRRDQFTWTTRSTQLLEGRALRWGAILFHVGLLAVIGGHVLGILVPESATAAVGVSEHTYHVVSVAAGTSAGVAMSTGFLLLARRRATNSRVRRTTTRMDIAVYVVLGVIIATGMYATVGQNLIGGGYNYRETVGPYFRSIFIFDPDTAKIAAAPFVYKFHALAAFGLYALWPFSRLVHAWSVPVSYLTRAPIVYRSRRAAPARALPETVDARS